MTTKELEDVLRRVEAWPHEDQQALVEYARELEARRTGVYRLTDEERAAIREGLEQARRGELVSDAEMDAFRKSSGAV
jgi:predicted transcriptional regulator